MKYYKRDYIDLSYNISKAISWSTTKLNDTEKLLYQHKNYNDYDVLSFDIETWGLSPSNLALGIFYNGSKYDTFYTIEHIKNYIVNLKNNTLIFAHNGVKFDFLIFFEELFKEDGGYSVIKEGDIVKLTHTTNKREIIFRDTVYMLPAKLDDLAKDLLDDKTQKLTIDDKFINPTHFKRNEYEQDVEAFNKKFISDDDITYCKRDCEALYKIVTHPILKEYGIDIINKNTIAGCAYKRLLLAIEEIKIFEWVDREFLKLFSGGLTDVYMNESSPRQNIVCYDKNSFYPWAMTQQFAIPAFLDHYRFNLLCGTKREAEIAEYFTMLAEYPNGYADIEFSVKPYLTDKEKAIIKKFPFFPVSGMNFFDYGDGRTYKASAMNIEIKNMLPFFNITPLEARFSTQMFSPFKDYTLELYNKRLEAKKEGKKALALIIKLLLNSAYGRFGMKTQNQGYEVFNFEDLEKWIIKKITRASNKNYENDLAWESETEGAVKAERFILDVSKLMTTEEKISYYKESFNEENSLAYEGFRIKSIKKIEANNQVTEPLKEDMYVISYISDKTAHKSSSYYFAAEITAKCRANLISDMINIELSGTGEVCYTDTDSIHIQTADVQKLEDYLNKKKMLSKDEIGLLKNEGVFQKGYWMAKKHYYLFNEQQEAGDFLIDEYGEYDKANKIFGFKGKEGDLFLTKSALKGFTVKEPIDPLVYERPVIFVDKMYTKLANVSFKTHTILEKKSFINFKSKRDENNLLLEVDDYSRDTKLHQHQADTQNLFFSLLKSNNLYIVTSNGAVLITDKIVSKRIEELKKTLEHEVESGLYSNSLDNFLSKTAEKKIKKYVKVKKTLKKKKKYVSAKSRLEALWDEIEDDKNNEAS